MSWRNSIESWSANTLFELILSVTVECKIKLSFFIMHQAVLKLLEICLPLPPKGHERRVPPRPALKLFNC